MPYTTVKLITNAYYLSGLVSRKLQTVTGDQISDGLDLLNAMLAVKSANVRLIPYYQQYNFTAVVGQEKYYVPGLVSIETLTFYIGSVRYSMQPQKRIAYWGNGRVDDINSLPYYWHPERVLGGTNIYIYFTPSQEFPMVIWGKFSLLSVALNQDLSLTLDAFFIEYLRYALAEQICQDNNISMQPAAMMRLKELESMVMYIDAPDLSSTNVVMYPRDRGFDYSDANIGQGWRS